MQSSVLIPLSKKTVCSSVSSMLEISGITYIGFLNDLYFVTAKLCPFISSNSLIPFSTQKLVIDSMFLRSVVKGAINGTLN